MTNQEESLNALKGYLLNLSDEEYTTRLFFEEKTLHDLMTKEKEYENLLLSRECAFELNPLKPTPYSFTVLVTPSARKEGDWQVTLFKGMEPQGHREYPTYKEAVLDNVTEWFNQGLWFSEDDSHLETPLENIATCC